MDMVCHNLPVTARHFSRLQRNRNIGLLKKRRGHGVLLFPTFGFLIDWIGLTLSNPSHTLPILFAALTDLTAHFHRVIDSNAVYWLGNQQCNTGNSHPIIGHHVSAIRFGQALTGYVHIEIFK